MLTALVRGMASWDISQFIGVSTASAFHCSKGTHIFVKGIFASVRQLKKRVLLLFLYPFHMTFEEDLQGDQLVE